MIGDRVEIDCVREFINTDSGNTDFSFGSGSLPSVFTNSPFNELNETTLNLLIS